MSMRICAMFMIRLSYELPYAAAQIKKKSTRRGRVLIMLISYSSAERGKISPFSVICVNTPSRIRQASPRSSSRSFSMNR